MLLKDLQIKISKLELKLSTLKEKKEVSIERSNVTNASEKIKILKFYLSLESVLTDQLAQINC
jgi:trans-2-enoyl-CoA reductase